MILIFCGADAAIALVRRGGTSRSLAIGATVLALPIVVYVTLFPDFLLQLMGKDPTLTGRTDIWDLVIPYIYERPWLGWGYVAFWSTTNPAAMAIADTLHWFAPQAHNGPLEMLLHVGVLGTAFFVFLWARTIWLSVKCMSTLEMAMGVTCLFSCIGIMLAGVSETVLIVPFEASTSVFFITGLLCERAVRVARMPRSAAARRYIFRDIQVERGPRSTTTRFGR